jgi:putative membrane protein
MVALAPLTDADRARIADSVARAEARTSVELRFVLAHRSSHYGAFALIYPGLVTLTLGGVAAVFVPDLTARSLFMGQAVVFAIAFAVLQSQGLRAALVPAASRQKAAWRHARLYYASIGLKQPHLKSVVLVFCSVTERAVEILVDDAVAEKLPESAWTPIVAQFTASLRRGAVADAFVAAADECAVLLAPLFPAKPGDANEVPDTLVEL